MLIQAHFDSRMWTTKVILCVVFLVGALVFSLSHYVFSKQEQLDPIDDDNLEDDNSQEQNKAIIQKSSVKVIPKTWEDTRKVLLGENEAVKVLLFGYQRGGTSVIRELFSCPSSTVMWQRTDEPIFDLHYGFNTPPEEVSGHLNVNRHTIRWIEYYDHLINCHYQSIPFDVLIYGHDISRPTIISDFMKCLGKGVSIKMDNCRKHIKMCFDDKGSIINNCHLVVSVTDKVIENSKNIPLPNDQAMLEKLKIYLVTMLLMLDPPMQIPLLSFVQYATCVELVKREKTTQECLQQTKNACNNRDIHVIEVDHLSFADLQPLIQANPDLNIIYYTRDPRAIAASIMSALTTHTDVTVEQEAARLCTEMKSDVVYRNQFEKKFPGVTKHVTFEELAHDLDGMARIIYRAFGRNRPECWNKFIIDHKDRNATETTEKWRSVIPGDIIKNINEKFSKELALLHYYL